MQKLVLLSDLSEKNNAELEKRMIHLIGMKSPKLGYIPSQSDTSRIYFNSAKEYFNMIGFKDYLYFDVDDEYEESLKYELLQCDAIFLSGGNTYYFLNNLKKRGVLHLLKEFVSRNKVLIGVSAGSILMSETIAIARFLDENLVNIRDLEALHLVDFDFMPHWDSREVSLNDVKAYSKNRQKVIYTCNDGDGLIVINNKVECYGDIQCIWDGK